MRRPEQRFWDRIKAANDRDGKKVYLERIENAVGSGRPDLDTLWRGHLIPIELKVAENKPAREMTALLGEKDGLNQQQKNWHKEFARYGGVSYIAIALELQIIVVDGALGDLVNQMPLMQLLNNAIFHGSTAGFIQWLKGKRNEN